MNDEFDELERELSALKPAPVSTELRSRIAADIPPNVVRSSAAIWRAASMAAAACIGFAVMVSLLPQHHTNEVAEVQPRETQETRPTFWNYHQLVDTPEKLDLLLEEHAATLLPPTREELMQAARWRALPNKNQKG